MKIGDKIPEILGIDQNGREIKASDFKGRWLCHHWRKQG